MAEETQNQTLDLFHVLRDVNVVGLVEQKGSLTYLSWAHALDQLMRHAPAATYDVLMFTEADGALVPYQRTPGGTFVWTKVDVPVTMEDGTLQVRVHKMWLPVMDNRNKVIAEPNAFDVNRSIMRCLAKNIATFGLGLAIYCGEDLEDLDAPAGTGTRPAAEPPLKNKSDGKPKATPIQRDRMRALASKTEDQTMAAFLMNHSAFTNLTEEDAEVIIQRAEAALEREQRGRAA